jgi:ubiquinone/menaquinone biosynthesis C-methylase UbiE
MRRIDAPEILDSENCPAEEVQPTLQTLDRINRFFGGVSTTQKMIGRVAAATGTKSFSVLDAAAGSGRMLEAVRQRLAACGVLIHGTLLDRDRSHLPQGNFHQNQVHQGRSQASVAGDALALPFADQSFDLVCCNLFAHHLTPPQLCQFVREGLRVSRYALLINDLVRHALHLGLVYASYPIMGSHVAWLDGLTSVRRAYVPAEIREIVAAFPADSVARIEITRHYLFRMGAIVWKA